MFLQRRSVSRIVGSACVSLGLLGCAAEGGTAGSAAAPSAPPPATAPPGVASAPPPPPAAPPTAPSPPGSPSAAASAAAAPAPSSPYGAELAEGERHREGHHGGFVGLILESAAALDLKPEQRPVVDKIRADLSAKLEPARAAGKELATILADGVAAGSIDRAKADAATAKLAAQVQGVHDAAVASLDQLHAALDPQQRAALADDVQARWARWKEAHGHDEDQDKQHHDGYLLALVRQLNLSREQAEKIKANFRDKMKASPQDHQHKEVEGHLQAFATAFKADTFSAKSLTGAKAANGHMARWGAARRVRFLEAAVPVLTPEQRTKLAQEIRDRANRSES